MTSETDGQSIMPSFFPRINQLLLSSGCLFVFFFLFFFFVKGAFETVFQSISDRLPKKGRQRRERIDESNMSK